MSNYGEILINDFIKGMIEFGEENIKKISPEQKKEYKKEIDGLSDLLGIDVDIIKDFFKANEKEEDIKPKQTEDNSLFNKKYGNKLNIDMDIDTQPEFKEKDEPKEKSKPKLKCILEEILHKIAMNDISIDDLNKETLECLINDKRSTDSTIDFVCDAYGIDRKVFNYLCAVLKVEDRRAIITKPTTIQYVERNDDLAYYSECFNITIDRKFKNPYHRNKNIADIISTFTKLLEKKGVLSVTLNDKTAIPFVKCSKSTHCYNDIDDNYGYAVFDIPLNIFLDNMKKITINLNTQNIPFLSIQK